MSGNKTDSESFARRMTTAKEAQEIGEQFLVARCAHHIWDFELSKDKQEAKCASCGVSVDVRAVAAFHPSTESKKTMNVTEFRDAALKYLESKKNDAADYVSRYLGIEKEKRSVPLVISGNNVRISGQMLEDAGVPGAKAPGKTKSLSDDCYHSSVEWRRRDDVPNKNKIEWVWGKLYKTRSGAPARFFDMNLNQMRASLELSGTKIFCVRYKDGLHDTDPSLDIVGLWEESLSPRMDQIAVTRDAHTPDDRRERVDLRTDAQIAHERAVLRLRQHRLARWGQAEHVRWEDEP